MAQCKQSIYFSQNEMRMILKHYSDLVHSKGFAKINYNDYRAMWDSVFGCDIVIDNLTNFYDVFINDLQSIRIDRGSPFGNFLYKYYISKHSDYIPFINEDEGELTMIPSTITTTSTSSTSSATTTLNDYSKEDLYYQSTGSVWNDYTTSKSIQVAENICKDKKEKKNMKGFNFDFGPCTNDNVRMSIYGLAVKNGNDEWVSYNPSTAQIVNVDILNFDGRKFMFKMPVAINDIAVGDIIIHNRVPMFVIGVGEENGAVIAVDARAGEEKKILPTVSPFGFNFVTKVVSMFSAFDNTPSPDTPFGNFLPFMLMGDNKEIDPMMIMMMMQNGNTSNMFNNPMMMYFLCGDKMKDNMLLLMMMMNQPIGNTKPSGK